ncbi:MAG: ATP-binding protein, partial [Thermoplasmata archaeon]
MKPIKFSFGRPVLPENLYDRKKEIDRIMMRLSTIRDGVKNDVVLVGPRRVGKSSIIAYLGRELSKEDILPIKMDCEGLDLVAFLKVYGNAIANAEIQAMGLMERFSGRLKKGFSEALSTMSEAIGRIRAVEVGTSLEEFLKFRVEFDKTTFHKSPIKREIESLFDRTVDLPNNLNKKCVVLFDEFQDTATYSLSRGGFHANFRSKMNDHKNVAYLYTGSAIGMMNSIFSDPSNPLAGAAEMIYIDPFDKKTSVSFLRTRFKEAGRKISEKTAQSVYKKVGGFPLYLNWIGLRVCDFVDENRCVTKTVLKKVFEEIPSPRNPIYHMIEKQLVKLGLKTRNVMLCIAEGYSIPSEIARESNVKNVYVYLERLQKYGLVRKKDGRYILIDPIITEHLKV